MEYHGLLQAFSRTNRVLNEKKRFGKVVCFRELKSNVDAAIKLFSNNQPNEFIIREPYENVKKELNELAIKFKEKYPNVQIIDTLQSEYRKRDLFLHSEKSSRNMLKFKYTKILSLPILILS